MECKLTPEGSFRPTRTKGFKQPTRRLWPTSHAKEAGLNPRARYSHALLPDWSSYLNPYWWSELLRIPPLQVRLSISTEAESVLVWDLPRLDLCLFSERIQEIHLTNSQRKCWISFRASKLCLPLGSVPSRVARSWRISPLRPDLWPGRKSKSSIRSSSRIWVT